MEQSDLRPDLLDCDEFRALLADRKWAEQAYLMFPNREWRSGSRRSGLSWRAAGSFVAEARADGEDYMDYYIPYCWGDLVEVPEMQERLADVFASAGWKEVGPDDRAEFFLDGLRLLVSVESRPHGELPDWYRPIAERHSEPEQAPEEFIDRVHYFARKGILTQNEFSSLISAFMISSDDRDAVTRRVTEARDAGEGLPMVAPASKADSR